MGTADHNPTLILAPLRGFTTSVFRNVYSRLFRGIDHAVAPFIPTLSSRRIRESHFKDILPEHNAALPVIPQLIGSSPTDFIRMAGRLADLGYPAVNWNLGCPFPMVAKKGRGSGLLPHTDRIAAFLDQVVPAIPIRLSIKARLGRHRPEEILDLIPVFNAYPLESLTIHPRTGVQMYSGKTDPEMFDICLRQSRIPLIYNGDIVSAGDVDACRRRWPGVAAWMIGRGLLINPFLPEEISGRSESDARKITRFRRFHDALFDAFLETFSGPAHLVDRMKGFWEYFARSFANSRSVLKAVHKSRTPNRYLSAVHRFLDEEAVWSGGGPVDGG